MKTLTFTLRSFFQSQLEKDKVSVMYVKIVDTFLVDERDIAVASSRMHHTSLMIAGMMQEEYKLKKLQFEIALDKILTTYPARIKKDDVGRIADEINAKLMMLLPYPIKEEVFEKVRTALLNIR